MAYACVDAKGSVMRNTAETQRCTARVHTAWRGVWRGMGRAGCVSGHRGRVPLPVSVLCRGRRRRAGVTSKFLSLRHDGMRRNHWLLDSLTSSDAGAGSVAPAVGCWPPAKLAANRSVA